MTKGSVLKEDMILVKIYAPKYIKQIPRDVKIGIDYYYRLIVGNFLHLSLMERSCIQKIRKATAILDDTVDHLNLIDIYRTSE